MKWIKDIDRLAKIISTIICTLIILIIFGGCNVVLFLTKNSTYCAFYLIACYCIIRWVAMPIMKRSIDKYERENGKGESDNEDRED